MRLRQANGTWQLNREEKTAMFKSNGKIGRRDLFKTSAGIMGGALLSREAAAEQAAQRNINTLSSPSAQHRHSEVAYDRSKGGAAQNFSSEEQRRARQRCGIATDETENGEKNDDASAIVE